MAKSDYIQPNDEAFSAQLNTFKTIIPDYATVLQVTGAQMASQAADADYFADCLEWQSMTRNAAQQATSWKDLIRRGGTPPASGAPVAIKLPPGTPVEPGIEPRFRALCQQIKASPEVNDSILEALGIKGPEQIGPDYATLAPVLQLSLSGGQVHVAWGWQGYSAFLDQIELQVDRADSKGWVLLAIDTTPGYTDTQPFPSAPTKWSYQAIYRAGDNRVGQWSSAVAIGVGA